MENKQIKIKRAYEKYSKNDGARILVDRLWPRGKTKKGLKIKEWMKDIAPSLELIKWFGHDQKSGPISNKNIKRS